MQRRDPIRGRSSTLVSSDELAGASLVLLRVLTAIADASLDVVAPQLSLQQFRALTVLHERGPQNAVGLAGALGIAPSTLTRLGDRLVRDDLVDRAQDPSDRRSVVFSVTRRGARIAERVKAWRLVELARRFEAVPAEEREAVLVALERCGALIAAVPG